MANKFEITIQGEPVAKGRPRMGRKGVYTPPKTRVYERYARNVLMTNRPQKLNGAVRMTVKVYRRIPQSMTKANRTLAIARILRPTVKPDLDNYVKTALDACNGIVFHDDNQVCEIVARKYYSMQPRLVIEVEEIE